MSAWLDAAQAAQQEPVGTPPGNLYFTYKRPDGDTFIGSAANAETYLRQGFTVEGELTIDDTNAFRELVSPGSSLPPASGTESTEATANSGAMPPPPPAP
ncbi:MAG TPA: hypothetical protein VFB50_00795 [Chloroflexota bacterium]|nr:hypothetical protein [Chloroflexota bacterium]